MVASLSGRDNVDATTVSFLVAENLAVGEGAEEEAEHEAHKRVLDRRSKDGVRLSSLEREAWLQWKWCSLGLPPQDDKGG